MRKTFCSLVLTGVLAITGSAAFAQSDATPQQSPATAAGGRHRMSPDEQLARMTKTLNLTPDQATQIKPILHRPPAANGSSASRPVNEPGRQNGQDEEPARRQQYQDRSRPQRYPEAAVRTDAGPPATANAAAAAISSGINPRSSGLYLDVRQSGRLYDVTCQLCDIENSAKN